MEKDKKSYYFLIFAVVFLVLVIFGVFVGTFRFGIFSGDVEMDRQDLLNYSEDKIQHQIKWETNTTVEDLYYSFTTYRILGGNKTEHYGDKVLDYIRSKFYEDEMVSNVEGGISDTLKASSLTVVIDNKVKSGLGRNINLSKLFGRELSYSSDRIPPEKAFYLSEFLNVVMRSWFDIGDPSSGDNRSRAFILWTRLPPYSNLREYYCNYLPEKEPKLKKFYYSSRVLETTNKLEGIEGYNYTIKKGDYNTSVCKGIQNKINYAECVKENIKYSGKETVECNGKNYLKKVREDIEGLFSSLEEIESLEELFWLYRVREYYGMDTDNMKETLMKDFYDSEDKKFLIRKRGDKTSLKANFYGVCMYNNCLETVW